MTDQTTPRDRLFALIASIPGSASVDWCDDARALVDEIAAQPARLPADEARTRLLQALDASYCQALGHTPEGLLAVYEASRTQTVDQDALRDRIAAAIRDAVCAGDCGKTEEECAKERIQPFAWHHGTLAVVEGSPEQFADAVLAAVLPATTNHDTDTSITPPPALTEEGRLRARVQVLEEDAERDQGLAATGARCLLRGHQGQIESGSAVIEGHRFALSTKLGLGTGAPWDAIHERVADLSRMVDETASDETQAAVTPIRVYLATPCATCDHTLNWHRNDVGCTVTSCVCGRFEEPAAGARQDGAQQ